MKKLFFTISLAFLSLISFSQYRNKDGNRIGITVGVSQAMLTTSNFSTNPGIGWNGGLSVRGNYYNNWSMIYGMQFFQNNFEVETVSPTLQRADTKFSLSGAQIRLLLSYNVVKNHVSLDFGPVLQINGKFKINSTEENYTISGQPTLRAKDISNVNPINGNAYVGISAGGTRLRAVLFYQYGFTNILNKLNSEEGIGNYGFKGNLSSVSAQLLFNL